MLCEVGNISERGMNTEKKESLGFYTLNMFPPHDKVKSDDCAKKKDKAWFPLLLFSTQLY